ncbi:MAG TPA: response regulator [Burkholderiaceae bacterium]|nr:response regulator [Burkholderiaceae bacterium]
MLLDDEPNVLNALQRTLRQCFFSEGLRIELFTDPEQALLRSGEIAFDVIVSDYRMPGMNGVEFLEAIKGIQPNAVRLVLSASTEFSAIMSAVNRAEVFRYIAKPWQTEDLKNTFSLAFERHDQMLEEHRLADEARARRGELTPQELEARRLEADEPGITKVNWDDDGAVRLD